MVIKIADYQKSCSDCEIQDCANCIVLEMEERRIFKLINEAGFKISWKEYCETDEWMEEYMKWAGIT